MDSCGVFFSILTIVLATIAALIFLLLNFFHWRVRKKTANKIYLQAFYHSSLKDSFWKKIKTPLAVPIAEDFSTKEDLETFVRTSVTICPYCGHKHTEEEVNNILNYIQKRKFDTVLLGRHSYNQVSNRCHKCDNTWYIIYNIDNCNELLDYGTYIGKLKGEFKILSEKNIEKGDE